MTWRNLLGSMIAGLVLMSAAACGSTATGSSSTNTHPSDRPTIAAQPPAVGACRNLTYHAAEANSDSTPTIPCTSQHTAVTVAVGSLVDKQHPTLTNVNSAAVQHRLIVTCKKDVNAYVGGGSKQYALSLVQAIWFLPTPEQIAAGAHWYRCDLVVLAGESRLAPLPNKMRNALTPSRALNRWGTCGNAAPSSPKFRRVLCSAPHKWRAVAVVDVPRKSAYLARPTGANASKKCGTIAANNAAGALRYTWSFQWPNKQQWQAGQRYGLCWLPKRN